MHLIIFKCLIILYCIDNDKQYITFITITQYIIDIYVFTLTSKLNIFWKILQCASFAFLLWINDFMCWDINFFTAFSFCLQTWMTYKKVYNQDIVVPVLSLRNIFKFWSLWPISYWHLFLSFKGSIISGTCSC